MELRINTPNSPNMNPCDQDLFSKIKEPLQAIHFHIIVKYGKNICLFSDFVDPGGPVVIILPSGSEGRGLDPVRGRWIFSERKNPKFDFLRKGCKSVGPVS